jgi:hypothetical protein
VLKYHIQTIEVGSGGASAITFSNIPQTYDDLLILISDRASRTAAVNDAILFRCNNTAMTGRRLFGSGSSPTSTADFGAINVAQDATANTFSSISFYLSNYSSSTVTKSASFDAVGENDATLAYQTIGAGLFNSTSPVTQISLTQETGSNFLQFSSASLYGIKRGSDGRTEVAAGGTIITSGGYTIHTFNSSGTFVANRDLDVEYLVIAGGGGGGGAGGGGAAGGYRTSVGTSGGNSSAESLVRLIGGTSYNIIVGSGGTGTGSDGSGSNGSPSSFEAIASVGGGGGGGFQIAGRLGGSGSGAGAGATGGLSVTNQGSNGGNGGAASGQFTGGGGGGASAVGTAGQTSVSGNGGNGLASSITGTSITRAGGGAGGCGSGSITSGTAGTGGAGTGGTGAGVPGVSATANTGSGGGGGGHGGASGGNGGSGVVIIRYLTP